MKRRAPELVLLGLLVASGACALSSQALAQAEADPAHDRALARSLFAEGVALLDAEDFEGAADRFRRARALFAAPSILYNLARAEAAIGNLVEASEALREILRGGQADESMRGDASVVLAEVEPRLAQLTVRVEAATDTSELRVDERTVPRAGWGIAMPVNPGPHRASLRDAEGVERVGRDLTLAEGEAMELTLVEPAPEPAVDLEPAEESPAPTPVEIPLVTVEPEADDSTALVAGLAIGGGVLLVVGGVLLALALTGSFDGPQPHCGNTDPCILVAP